MSQAKRHIHKYYQVEVSSNYVWACSLPDCNHYIPYHMRNLVNGKASICWNCGEKMILNPANMKMIKPICDDCLLTQDDSPIGDKIKQFIESESESSVESKK